MHFDFDENGFLRDLKGLIRIKSVNEDCGAVTEKAPLGQGIFDAIEYMLNLGRQYGFRTKNVGGSSGWIEMGPETGDIAAVLAHLDTVSIDEGWNYPPFDTTVADGRVYGRGIGDDKGPALLALYAMKAVYDSGSASGKRVRLILGGDEENQWRCMQRYRQTEEIPSRAFTPDADYPVTYAEKGILNVRISAAFQPGIHPLELHCGHTINMVPAFAEAVIDGKRYTAQGKAAHAMCPELGDNALLKLCGMLQEQGVDHPFVRLASILDAPGLRIDFEDAPSGKLTISPSVASCDEKNAFVDCDLRIPVTVDKDSVLNAMAESVSPYGFHVEELMWEGPLYVDKNSPLVATLQEVYRECTGDLREPVSTGGGTYARVFPNAVAFGALLPGHAHTFHKNDEYWTLESIRTNFQIFSNAILRF